MADSDLSLLFKLRGDASSAKTAVAETRAAVSQLRSSFGSEFNQIQNVSNKAFAGITNNLSSFVTQRVPLIGTAFSKISGSLQGFSEEAAVAGEAAETAGASIGAMAGPVGIAIVGILATATAVGVLGKELFSLAQASADFRGKLFDMSQQTGVAVETLNALDIALSKTGGNSESAAQSLVVFQGKLEEAQDASSDTGKKFAELGISTNNTEDALRDAFKALAAMPEGFHQTNEAAELFGKRGGKQFLAVLKETHGNVDSAVSSLGNLARVTKEEAKAADDFNDALRDIQILLRGVTAVIGSEIVPRALEALDDLKNALKENEDGLHALGVAAGIVTQLFTLPLKGAIGLITSEWRQHKPELLIIAELYERIAAASQLISGKGLTVDPNAIPALTNTGVSTVPEVGIGIDLPSLPGKKGQFKGALAASEDAAKERLELERHLREQLSLEFEKKNSDLVTHYQKLQTLTDDHLVTVNNQIKAERAAIQLGFQQGAIDQEEFNKRKADLDLRAREAQNKRDEETLRLKFEKQKALDAQEIQLRERSLDLDETQRKGELDRLQAALSRHAELESNVITRQLKFLGESHKERIGIINFEITALSTSTERKKELDQEKRIAEQEYTDEVKRLTRERIIAINEEDAARTNRPESGFGSISPNDIAQQAGALANIFAGEPPEAKVLTLNDAFLKLGESMAGVFGAGKDAAIGFADIMGGAFSSLANGIGNMVESYVLLGSAGPQALRKLLAATLAQIAAESAVRAIFELAKGFAALFFNPAEAAAHFTSAALFGSIAGVAAVAGRAIAGDAFKQPERGASGSRASSASSGSGSSGAPSTIEANRRTSQTAQQGMTLTLVVPHGWLGSELKKDYDLNGYSRLLITSGT